MRRDEAVFDAAAAEIDALLPGAGRSPIGSPPGTRRFVDPGRSRCRAVVDWLVATVPAACGGAVRPAATARTSGSGSSRDQPWTGYNWYDGGRRSRVDINTDLPVRAPDLVHVAAHETYPGHHLEHAWKEAELVDAARPARGERSC